MFNTIALQAEASSSLCKTYFPATKAEGIQIIFPDGINPRSRKVVTRSRARKTGKIPSWKMKRMVQWESNNERVVYRILDADPTVTAFLEQPFMVHYMDDGVERAHYPDVLIKFHDGVEVWEIKDTLDSDCPDINKRTEHMVQLFAQFEIRYRLLLVDKKHLKGTDSYSNCIRRLGRLPISQVERECARRTFEQQKILPWGHIKKSSMGTKGPNIVARLLLEGELTSSDRSQALSPATQIFVSSNKQPLVAEWRS